MSDGDKLESHHPNATVEHGRQAAEAIHAFNEEQQKTMMEATRQVALKNVGHIRENRLGIANAFPQLEKEHLELTRPPGVMGEFVLATESGTYKPFMKFAIPTVFAAISGIVGRAISMRTVQRSISSSYWQLLRLLGRQNT